MIKVITFQELQRLSEEADELWAKHERALDSGHSDFHDIARAAVDRYNEAYELYQLQKTNKVRQDTLRGMEV